MTNSGQIRASQHLNRPGIFLEYRIGSQENHALDQGLCQEQSVKRVPGG
jgi:hypothetical protein